MYFAMNRAKCGGVSKTTGKKWAIQTKKQTRIACLHCCEFLCLPFLDWHRARTPLRLGFLHGNMHKWFITFHSSYEIWNVKFIAFMAVLHVSSFHVFGYRCVPTFGLTFGYFTKTPHSNGLRWAKTTFVDLRFQSFRPCGRRIFSPKSPKNTMCC